MIFDYQYIIHGDIPRVSQSINIELFVARLSTTFIDIYIERQNNFNRNALARLAFVLKNGSVTFERSHGSIPTPSSIMTTLAETEMPSREFTEALSLIFPP